MKLTYSKPILHEHSNKKRPPSTVCDEMCFHGRSRKTIISLQHLVRSVVSKLGAVNVRQISTWFALFSDHSSVQIAGWLATNTAGFLDARMEGKYGRLLQ